MNEENAELYRYVLRFILKVFTDCDVLSSSDRVFKTDVLVPNLLVS